MEKIRTINSYVAIRIPYITKTEVEFLDTTIELQQVSHMREKSLACTHGIIESLPETNTDIHNHFTHSVNTMEIGDVAYFDKGYMTVHGRLTAKVEKDTFNLLFEDEHGKVLLVPSRAIIMVKRDGKFLAQNDYIVGTRVEMPKNDLEIEDNHYKDRIKVLSSCENVSYTAVTKGLDTDFKVKEGSIAITASDTISRISDEYDKSDLYVIKQRQVIGTID